MLPKTIASRQDRDNKDIHEIVLDIKTFLDESNVLVKSFEMPMSEIELNPQSDVEMKLIGKRSKDARTYNLLSVSEVVALIV